MKFLRVHIGWAHAADNMRGAPCASEPHYEAFTTVRARQQPQIMGALPQPGTPHTQRENNGIAFQRPRAVYIHHPERLGTGLEKLGKLRVRIQGLAHRPGNPLGMLRARRHHRQRTFGTTVGVLKHQTGYTVHFNARGFQVRVIAHLPARINILNTQRAHGLAGCRAHRNFAQVRPIEFPIQVVEKHAVKGTMHERERAVRKQT